MGPSARQPVGSHVPARERRPELIRSDDRRRQFPQREAQRRLRQKEIAWAPAAYGVFLVAVLVIFAFAYTSYAFSKYRGVILPGVHVDQVDVSGMSATQAEAAISNQSAAIGFVPVRLRYGSTLEWQPTRADIGFRPDITGTVNAAMLVGRSESFVVQLLDRLPVHPSHSVPLLYTLRPAGLLRQYVINQIAHGGGSRQGLYSQPHNAQLRIDSSHDWHVYLVHGIPGANLDVNATVNEIHQALGSLSKVVIPLRVFKIQPQVTDADANAVASRVERFLAHPPVIAIGKRVVVTTRAQFGPMFSFGEPTVKGRAGILLNIDSNQVQSFVSSLAAGVDRPPKSARLQFNGGRVQVVSPRRTGRTLDQASAFAALLKVVKGLQPNARLHFKVSVTQPPIDTSNPADLGINSLLGTGETSFVGADSARLQAVTAVAQTLNNLLIPAGQDISFNTIMSSVNWDPTVYDDRPRVVGNRLLPGRDGAMQQVATTFLRALYDAGLPLLERHPHTYRLPWYEPPIGLDAVVAPGRNWDLRFQNDTHHSLLLQAQVQPLRQQVVIYVYGPRLNWHVSVDSGQVTRTYPHGGQIVRHDPALSTGQQQHLAFADDGASTVIQRTITYPNGSAHVDQLHTTYQPSQAVLAIGPGATPTPTPGKPGKSTPSPSVTGTPSVTPTPTFNH